MRNHRSTRLAAVAIGAFALQVGTAYADDNSALDKSVMHTLHQCQQISTSCARTTKDAVGILIFPSVVKADLLIGGAGGEGALVENGKITGYYNIGAASAGLQIGIDDTKQVYVFRNQNALNQLKEDSDWKVGASAGVTVVKADSNAQSVNGDVLAYLFNSKGLNAGVSVDLLDVWKQGQPRPKSE